MYLHKKLEQKDALALTMEIDFRKVILKACVGQDKKFPRPSFKQQ